MKVLLLTKYDYSGASSRYRTLQYLPYLAERGVQVTVQSLLGGDYIQKKYSQKRISLSYCFMQYLKRLYFLLTKKKHYDLFWIEGELFPYLPFFIEKYVLPKPYIVEYDDAIFHNYDLHPKSFIRNILGNKIKNIMCHARHVIVGNEYVKDYAVGSGVGEVTILPTVVDATVYRPADVTVEHNPALPVVIGWLGSPTTVKYLKEIESIFVALSKKANVKFIVIGGEFSIPGVQLHCHHWPDKWSESEETALLQQIDIGIMPLINAPWEKGKCGFKLIKYMACGKSVVASPVSSNQEIVSHEKNGYLAETLEEWEACLMDLVENAEKRLLFGYVGRQAMIEKYSLQATAPELLKIMMSQRNVNDRSGSLCIM